MISPSKQKVIQIDVTNACPHKCANCTRFVGHHKSPFFVTESHFSAAVDSLKGYQGMVGFMGGEPTLHPKFAELVKILAKKVPEPLAMPKERVGAIKDFAAYRNLHLGSMKAKRGLWTSLGPQYYKHYELIQDTFRYQCINDHSHLGKHIALLVPRKELGVPDETWTKLRDACWVQNNWSASITPKGAFFCEVAGALDLLFGGPGGWPIEPGWWKRTPDEFGKQLEWCEVCSACLPVPQETAVSGVDTVTKEVEKRLRALGSKKKTRLFDPGAWDWKTGDVIRGAEPYLPAEGNSARVAGTNSSIRPRRISAVIVCCGYDDYLGLTLERTKGEVDDVLVMTEKSDTKTQALCDSLGVDWMVSTRVRAGGAPFAKGRAVSDGLRIIATGNPDWLLHLDADVLLQRGFGARIKGLVLNPGVLYYARRWGPSAQKDVLRFAAMEESGVSWEELYKAFADKEKAKFDGRRGNAEEAFPFGYFQLWNPKASSLVGKLTPYPETSLTAEKDDLVFGTQWFPPSRSALLDCPDFDVIHFPHGLFQQNWRGRVAPRLDSGEELLDAPRVKSRKYICVNPCFYKGKMYKEGEDLVSSGNNVPRHFREFS